MRVPRVLWECLLARSLVCFARWLVCERVFNQMHSWFPRAFTLANQPRNPFPLSAWTGWMEPALSSGEPLAEQALRLCFTNEENSGGAVQRVVRRLT